MMLPGLMIFWRLSARSRSLWYHKPGTQTFEHDLPFVLVLVALEDLAQPRGGDIKFRWLQPREPISHLAMGCVLRRGRVSRHPMFAAKLLPRKINSLTS